MEKSIPALLKQYRMEAGLTQQQVADKIHVSRNTYTQYENGSRRIDVDLFMTITEALGVTINIRDWRNIEKKLADVTASKKEWDKMRNEFFRAIDDGDILKVREYLANGMDVEIRNEKNQRAFIVALGRGLGEMVALLLAHGATYVSEWDYEWEDDWEGPLTYASAKGYYRVIKALLEWGRDVDDEIDYGPTPIEAACWNEHYDVVRLLMKHGANLNIKWHHGSVVAQLIEKKKDNMLLYIKQHYFVQLNAEQQALLDEYIEKYQPVDNRKETSSFGWAWRLANTHELDEVQARLVDEQMLKKNSMDMKDHFVLLTKEYENNTHYLIALIICSIELLNAIYEDLKTMIVQKLTGLDEEGYRSLLDNIHKVPTYQ